MGEPEVTVEGSMQPSAWLPRGERRTVRLTDQVQRLIDKGFVTVVKYHDEVAYDVDEPEVEAALAHEEEPPGEVEAERIPEGQARGSWSQIRLGRNG